jgi:hypothetical protein
MLNVNQSITIEQGDLCWFRDANGELKQGKYWYSESDGLVFYGENNKMYKGCSFVKNCERADNNG